MEILTEKGNIALFDFSTIKVSKARGTRACLIEDFVTELNKGAGTKYKVGDVWKVQKEYKPSFIGFKLSFLTVSELFYFLSMCRQSKSGFSKCFWGSLKIVDKKIV